MEFKRLCISPAATIGLAVSASSVSGEELSVATFVPPQHHTNTVMFKWFGEELAKRSDGSLTIQARR